MQRGKGGRSVVVVVVLALAGAASAAAQTPAAGAPTGGAFVVERVPSGPVMAADVKVTDFDNTAGTLVGGYAGWLSDQRFLVGGAGYWLANGANNEKLVYGGLLVGWTFRAESRVGFGVRGLFGGGQGTLVDSITLTRNPGSRRGRNVGPGNLTSADYRYQIERTFLVFEPQAQFVIRITDALRLDCSGGYRVAGAGDGLDERFSGATGSVALRFGGGR